MKRALISVTDKTGVVEFARGLRELGFGILSTGGTARVLAEAGLKVQEVADYTGFPEMMEGRIKTLHPKVHGGILARRGRDEDDSSMAAHGIDCIDVVVVNLYRFQETVRRPDATREQIVENIDIGGPAMVRSAAKNHAHVAVVVDPADYPTVLAALKAQGGALPSELAGRLAAKAFAHTASYDAAVASWFDQERRELPGEMRFSSSVTFSGEKLFDLRYGENPHQQAAFYAFPDAARFSLTRATKLCGKELSYNNILDLDAALALVLEFDGPACAIIKHSNPCGTGMAESQRQAFEVALAGDPVSAFGGIHAYNRTLHADTAEAIVESKTFVEAIVAPRVEPAALEALQKAKWGRSVRVLELGGTPMATDRAVVRQVYGGFLLQTPDAPAAAPEFATATSRSPTDEELEVLSFAWNVCKHVKSNAIVLAQREPDGSLSTVGVGAGQMSRVDSVKLAVEKAGDRAKGSVLASDAFFPFADGLQVAAAAGVTAVVQPGGSVRDQEVVAAADEAGMAMVFTGQRHFRH